MSRQENHSEAEAPSLKIVCAALPEQPGVYQFFDKNGRLLYVGKAKNIRKRVSTYFGKEPASERLRVMTRQIHDIRCVVVDSEYDALLLENSLIKKHQPRYNINLRDDKTYPWIVIKNERFPRVFYTRKLLRDGSQYFGPYASVQMVHTLLELITGLFKLRNCSYVLSEKNIAAGKFRPCIEYDVGNCQAPCAALQSEAEYNQTIEQVRSILRGNLSSVMNYLKEQMHAHAARQEYELAHEFKEKIKRLEHYQSKSVIVNPSIRDVDVITVLNEEEEIVYANYLRVVNGTVIQSHSFEIKKKLNESREELLVMALMEMRTRYQSTATEVIVPFLPEIESSPFTFHVPVRGDKRKLLELSLKNAFHYRKEKLDKMDALDPSHRVHRLLSQLQRDLRLSEQPHHIECFDNSNFHGDYPVAAMSVFIDARPARSQYRHFNIKTVEGPDDYASMEEVIYRRYKRQLEENKPLPQLIVIDGGKGQLNSAVNSLKKLGLYGKIAIIGIAKRLEEIYFPEDPLPLYLDKRSESLRLLQHLRDEAHRFGLQHHRQQRSKGVVKSELTEIKGIGPSTARTLLQHFRSVKKIREASFEMLAKVVGKAKAHKVKEYFEKEGDMFASAAD
jgi:excinuclease ABC subunit C